MHKLDSAEVTAGLLLVRATLAVLLADRASNSRDSKTLFASLEQECATLMEDVLIESAPDLYPEVWPVAAAALNDLFDAARRQLSLRRQER